MKLPKFFGIDIGKNTVKLAEVDLQSKTAQLVKLASFQTGQGSLTTEDLNLRKDLSKRLKDGVASAKLSSKKCIVSLPEPVVFSRLLTFPALDEKALDEAVHWNAKQYLPIPVEEVQKDYIKTGEIIVEGKKMFQILLVAAPKKIVNQVVEIFKDAELELLAIETESIASSRSIAYNYPGIGSVLVIDIGAAGTDLSIVSDGKLIFSQSLGTGSEAMTKAIMTSFSLDLVQAEQYKVKFGLLSDQAEGKIYKTLEPVVSIILSEIIKTINFFRSKFQQATPTQILLLGDGGQLPGLTQYLTAKIGMPSQQANLLQRLEVSNDIKKDVNQLGNIQGFGVAIGLALKTE